MVKTTKLMKSISLLLFGLFTIFLVFPLIAILVKSVQGDDGWTLAHYETSFTSTKLITSFLNSLSVSAVAAIVTTLLAFMLAYTVHFTRIPNGMKKFIHFGITLPKCLIIYKKKPSENMGTKKQHG